MKNKTNFSYTYRFYLNKANNNVITLRLRFEMVNLWPYLVPQNDAQKTKAQSRKMQLSNLQIVNKLESAFSNKTNLIEEQLLSMFPA